MNLLCKCVTGAVFFCFMVVFHHRFNLITIEHNRDWEHLYRQERTRRVIQDKHSESVLLENSDDYYANHTAYVRNSAKDRLLPHFGNEKKLFVELTKNTHPSVSQQCMNFADILTFFYNYNENLMISCGPDRVFSHCQLYYLFSINMKDKICSSYHRESYLNAETPNEVTLTTQLSFSRFDRIPYLLKRWKGPISVGVFVRMEEYPAFVRSLLRFLDLPITFSVYIPLGLKKSSYFIRKNKTREFFPDTLYPINLLRDLAIESIHTTHFFYVDADFFISDTVAKAVRANDPLLKNEFAVLLFTTYQTTGQNTYYAACKNKGVNCTLIWDSLPLNKDALRKGIQNKLIHPIRSMFHNITNLDYWIQLTSTQAYETEVQQNMEPYFIMRRSPLNPLFHPYYIEYGFDKTEFFKRLYAYHRYKYYVLPQDFGIDIPHKKSSTSQLFSHQGRENPMKELRVYANIHIRDYTVNK